ncbi:hypothetical protein BDR26DRAFT_849816 [Obelidium mucronatum]|nr:hypothetical protein BDR26DRAFT_849816 [Obelidium mucronatum]
MADNLIVTSLADSYLTAPLDVLSLFALYIHVSYCSHSGTPSLVSYATVAMSLLSLLGTTISRAFDDDEEGDLRGHLYLFVVLVVIRLVLLMASLHTVLVEGSGLNARDVDRWMNKRAKGRRKLDLLLFGDFIRKESTVQQRSLASSGETDAIASQDCLRTGNIDEGEGSEVTAPLWDDEEHVVEYEHYLELQAKEDELLIVKFSSHSGVGFFTTLLCILAGVMAGDWISGMAKFGLACHSFALLPQVVMSLSEFLHPSPLLVASLVDMTKSSAQHQKYLPLTLPFSILLTLLRHVVDVVIQFQPHRVQDQQDEASLLFQSIYSPYYTGMDGEGGDDEYDEQESDTDEDADGDHHEKYTNAMEEMHWKAIEPHVYSILFGLVVEEGKFSRWMLGKDTDFKSMMERERMRWRQRRRNEPLPIYSR